MDIVLPGLTYSAASLTRSDFAGEQLGGIHGGQRTAVLFAWGGTEVSYVNVAGEAGRLPGLVCPGGAATGVYEGKGEFVGTYWQAELTGLNSDRPRGGGFWASGEALTGGDVEHVGTARTLGRGSALVRGVMGPDTTGWKTGGGLGGGSALISSKATRIVSKTSRVIEYYPRDPYDQYWYIDISGTGGSGGALGPPVPDPSSGGDDLDGTGGTGYDIRGDDYDPSDKSDADGSGGYTYTLDLTILGGHLTYVFHHGRDGTLTIIIYGWRSPGYGEDDLPPLPEQVGMSGADESLIGNPFESSKPYTPGRGSRGSSSGEATTTRGGSITVVDVGTRGAGKVTVIDNTKVTPYELDPPAADKNKPLTYVTGGPAGNSPGGGAGKARTDNTESEYGSPGGGDFSPYAHMGINAGLTLMRAEIIPHPIFGGRITSTLPRMTSVVAALRGARGTFVADMPLMSSTIRALQGVIGVVDAALVLIRCKLYPRPANPARLVMATNTLTGAVSTYEDFPFNAFCELGGVYFGSGPDGVCRLDVGDTDVDAPISAGIGTGYSILGDSHQKRLINAYVKARIQSPLRMKVSTDERSTDEVALTPGTTDKFVNHRVAVARGLRGKHWMFEVNNTDGGRFDLGHIEVEFAPSTRRV